MPSDPPDTHLSTTAVVKHGFEQYIVSRDAIISADTDVWIYGYGSLTWRPAFPFAEQRPAWIKGFQRVWYQGSTDHRGTVEKPGRVVTIVSDAEHDVVGMAYKIDRSQVVETLDYLDVREQGGYVITHLPIYFHGEGKKKPQFDAIKPDAIALCYVAVQGNSEWLGPAPTPDIAHQICHSVGPSGRNPEYLLRLAEFILHVGGCVVLRAEQQTYELYHAVSDYEQQRLQYEVECNERKCSDDSKLEPTVQRSLSYTELLEANKNSLHAFDVVRQRRTSVKC